MIFVCLLVYLVIVQIFFFFFFFFFIELGRYESKCIWMYIVVCKSVCVSVTWTMRGGCLLDLRMALASPFWGLKLLRARTKDVIWVWVRLCNIDKQVLILAKLISDVGCNEWQEASPTWGLAEFGVCNYFSGWITWSKLHMLPCNRVGNTILYYLCLLWKIKKSFLNEAQLKFKTYRIMSSGQFCTKTNYQVWTKLGVNLVRWNGSM